MLRGRQVLGWLGIACAVLMSSASQAWDAQRMMAAARARGPEVVASAQALQALLLRAAGQDEKERVRLVNDFFNRRVQFQEDMVVWGVEDYWASPLEVLAKGRGDCEDYAIAKYFSLVAAGVPAIKLRLVYVQARLGGPTGPQQAHLVLAYYDTPAGDPLILDNLLSDVRPASQRPDLTPVFSFNSDGLWQGVGGASAGDPVARLSRWRDVLGKARAEGFQ